MEDFNSKYTGEQVEAILDSVVNGEAGGGGGGITVESDPIFSASPAASITEEKKAEWDGKMDNVTLATVATTGSYNDLFNKPTIPSAVTESTVSGWGFTKNTGTYSKPSGGIPKTDLASTVQTSLGKADTALQSYTEQYKGTVTKVKINGSEKSPDSNGVVDLGMIEGGGSSSGMKNVLTFISDGDVLTLKPNERVICYGVSLRGLTISGFEVTPFSENHLDNADSWVDEYSVVFRTDLTDFGSITVPDYVLWANGMLPEIEDETVYELSITRYSMQPDASFTYYKAVLTPFKAVE